MLASRFAPLALVSVLAAFSATAKASEAIAKLTVDAGGDFEHPALADVTLEADGHLTVQKTVYDLTQQGASQPLTTGEQTVTVLLDKATLDVVLGQIVALSSAEIQTTHSTIVCMMMPRFGAAKHVLQVRQGYDWQTKGFGGDLATVDNNAGCWQSVHIQPKTDGARTAAKVLEGELQVLSLTALAR